MYFDSSLYVKIQAIKDEFDNTILAQAWFPENWKAPPKRTVNEYTISARVSSHQCTRVSGGSVKTQGGRRL